MSARILNFHPAATVLIEEIYSEFMLMFVQPGFRTVEVSIIVSTKVQNSSL